MSRDNSLRAGSGRALVDGSGAAWPPRSYLASLAESMRSELLALGPRRVFSPEQVFITEGDENRDVFVLVGGIVKVTATAASGAQKLIDMQVGGDTVGEMAALDGQRRSATVSAAGRVAAVQISSEDLIAFFQANPAASDAMTRMLSQRLRLKISQILDFGEFDARTRLARTLVALAEKCGSSAPGGVTLDMPLTQPELASLVGMSEPAVHKAMRVLRDGGAITTGYRRLVILDMVTLRAAAELAPA
jgi:CRP/FNR family transcriptional regulator, cyclic AMP receptor protein